MEQFAVTPGKFQGNWKSLQQYECPDWFRNAKFGVWAHWSPQCVPMIGDWYARKMYIEGSDAYKFHCAHYGHPSKVGYKDVAEQWKAENFDPDGLMKLYKEMGAKFFVCMGVHHDNFDCWNSKHHSWNAVNHGPKKDIVGLWKAAAEKQGMRFGVSEHLERSYSWFATNKGADQQGPYKGVPYDGNDPAFRELYLNNSLGDDSPAYPVAPSMEFVSGFYRRIKDLVESYHPDWLYSDGGVPFGKVGLDMIANFYNSNMAHNGGKLEAVYCYKDINHIFTDLYHGEYQEGAGVLDLERTLSPDIRPLPWQTDTCIGDWFYKEDVPYKSPLTVIRQLCDVVSKNGTYLLSIPLRPDGTIDQKEKQIIADIAEWMQLNGEAIYETRPYEIAAEDSGTTAGQTLGDEEVAYAQEDFRFTTNGNVLYAVSMAPGDKNSLRIKSLGKYAGTIKSVTVLGGQVQQFSCSSQGLDIHFTGNTTAVGLNVFKIVL